MQERMKYILKILHYEKDELKENKTEREWGTF